jgi:hypothetical protein
LQIRFVIILSALAITFMVAACQKPPAIPASTALPPPVSTVPPPSIASFEAAPPEIASGQASTLTWKVSGATRVEISQDVGTVSQSGSVQVKPSERTVYTLTASNSGGSVSKNVEVNVTQNLAAKPIALSIEEMEALGFVFNMNSEPTMQHTISTYYVMFLRSRGSELYIDNTIYVFNTVSEAEKIFAEDKSSNKTYVAGYETIGTQGYYLEVKGNPPTPSIYSIYFQKNNIYVRVRSNLPLSEIEAFARIIEKRIH